MLTKLSILSLGLAALMLTPAPLHALDGGDRRPEAGLAPSGSVSARVVPVQAGRQMACSERDMLVEQLASTYGESRRGIGLAANNTLMEIFASDSGSWTITITLATGQTCIVASGEAYEDLDELLPATGKGA